MLRKTTLLLLGALALLTTVALPAAAQRANRSATAAAPLRVMSFNIRYNTPADKENAWQHRIQMVASMFRFHRADLVGVQEALRGQIADLEKQLPDYAWCGVGRDDGKARGEFSAIFYRKDRFELLSQATFWLSPTPQLVGSKGWDAALPRIVTWAKFRDRATRVTFFHFNTHFDHRGEQARLESARLLVAEVARLAGQTPVVVTGDFNAVEDSAPYRALTSEASATEKLQDARYLSAGGHHGPISTFNGFAALRPDYKIDYVFVKSGIRVLQHGALADQWEGGRWPSDHLPVLAELGFAKGRE